MLWHPNLGSLLIISAGSILQLKTWTCIMLHQCKTKKYHCLWKSKQANTKQDLETLQQELSQTLEVPMTLGSWWPAQNRRQYQLLVSMVGMDWQLDLMVLVVFSNLNYSVILSDFLGSGHAATSSGNHSFLKHKLLNSNDFAASALFGKSFLLLLSFILFSLWSGVSQPF